MQEDKEVIKKESTEENANESMSFWDHLEVLRWAFFRSACVLLLCLIGTFSLLPPIFDDFILAATSNDFFVYRWLSKISHGMITFSPDFNVQIININVASQFMTHITTALYLGLLCASPYILVELFHFITPALYENEKKHSVSVAITMYLLFVIGVLMSYFVLFPISFRFLGTYSVSGMVESNITLKSYISTFTTLTLVMGLVFQLPVIAFFLGKLEVVTASMLKQYRKYAFLVIMVVAAIITPPDLMTLVLVTIPLYLLYEVSILALKRMEKR